MLLPKSRIRFTTSYQGKSDPEGWFILDLAGLELDGVSKIYLPGADVEKLRKQGDTSVDRLKQVRDLLGGELDEDKE